MWRNYWTVAVRALAKSKTYSIINIAGLAIGMAACIMILLYIRYEQSYDKWIPDAENTFQFQAWYPTPESGGEPTFLQMAAYVTKDRVKKDFPQVVNAVYVQDSGPVFLKDATVEHVDDAAREVGMRRGVSDHDDGRTLLVELAEHAHDFLAVRRVEVAGRFVGEDQLGLSHQGAGNGDPLLLTAGQLSRTVLGAMSNANLVEHRIDPRLALG